MQDKWIEPQRREGREEENGYLLFHLLRQMKKQNQFPGVLGVFAV